MAAGNRTVRLARRPQGEPVAADWTIADEPVAAPGPNQVLVEVTALSVDPAMRGWLDDVASYLPPVALGEVMRAIGTGVVLRSAHHRFPVGSQVHGMLGVQRLATPDVRGLTLVDPSLGSARDYLGVLGQTGLTAYFGLFEIGRPRAGDTVVVSAAAGAVGSVVGQLARLAGCRVVGIAGGPDKCAYVVDDLGFHAAIDYRNEDVATALATSCPDGVDVFFDNVGGDVLDATLLHLARGARVVLCGAISQYNSVDGYAGPANYWQLLVRRATMQGFLVFDFTSQYSTARARLAAWQRDGELVGTETVVEGRVDDFPEVLLRLFRGDNRGKLVLSLGAPGE